MVFKSFRIQCIVRIVLLGASIYLFIYLLTRGSFQAPILIIGFFCIYQMISLIHYIEKTNRDLTRFLQSIKYADFSQSFSSGSGGASFKALNDAFNDVINEFQRARSEKEEHFRYLQTVVQHVGVGLIAFQQNGEVELINNTAKRLLKIVNLKNIQTLSALSETLVAALFRMKSGEKSLVRIIDKDEVLQLAVYTTQFKLRERQFTLASIQNIQNELEEKEMEAWQNLIRVLTHEIMNSITPIASLTGTANDLLLTLDQKIAQKHDPQALLDDIVDVRTALQTIEKRSHGLLRFVDAYRNLTRIPKPNFQLIPVAELFERVKQLMRSQIFDDKLAFHTKIDPLSLELTADPVLIEQVLINLLKNACQSVQKQSNARIDLVSFLDERGRINIQVIDNGPGIIPEAREKLFVPFFTTKKDGSGIGLSLSRQIMRLHKGSISVNSQPNVETIFTLKF